MLDAAVKSFAQMLSPPFRTVLLKSMGLAAVLLVVFAIALHRLIAWLAAGGETLLEAALRTVPHPPLALLVWVPPILAAPRPRVGRAFPLPAAPALVGGLVGGAIAQPG